MVTLEDINVAQTRISPFIHRTPIYTCNSLNELTGAKLYFKCDNFQKAGSFKIRGATNTVLQLSPEELNHGVITTSSGNHGAALALAATKQGADVQVVMPNNTSRIKIQNVERYGGKIIYCEPNHESRENTLKEMVERTGAIVVHPYNDERIVAGQGTAANELLTDLSSLDAIISPVSGGGLLCGTLLAAKGIDSNIKVYGAEPMGADDTYRSIQEGKIVPNKRVDTIADGLRAQVGTITFPIIQEMVDEIIPVSEETIIDSMRMIWERLKIMVEPSSSIVLGGLLSKKEVFNNKKVGLILSGGNVDLDNIPW